MASLNFENINYSVGDLHILKDISGCLKPGRLCAIMGASGSGKTTLLNLLSMKAMVGDLSGSITLGSSPLPPSFKHRIGYVYQEDRLLNVATVYETLLTSAQLRCRGLDASQIEDRVNGILQDLNLEHRRDSFIGDENVRGVSGGEKRRVSIGEELVIDCDVLFLDEPTSGLDSNTAETVVDSLLKIANKGKIVACTIHQPNSDITSKFDDFILLSRGRLVYAGPWSESVRFFSEAGFECPLYTNPSDFFLKMTFDEENEERLVSFFQSSVWSAAQQKGQEDGEEEEEAKKKEEEPSALVPFDGLSMSFPPTKQDGFSTMTADKEDGEDKYPTSFSFQTYVLAVRFFKQWLRDPLMFEAELSQYIFMAVFLGSIYFQLGNGAEDGSFDRISALFLNLTILVFTPPFTTITIYQNERWMFLKERENNAYRISAYYIAKTLVMWPIEIFFCLIFSAINYYMVGFQPDAKHFGNYLAILIVFQLVGESTGLICAVGTPNATIAIVAMSFLLIVFFALTGFLTSTIPPYYEWILPLNFFTYSMQACILNEFEGLTFHTQYESGGNVTRLNIDAMDTVPRDLKTDLSLEELLGVLFLFLVIFRFLGYVLLHYEGVSDSVAYTKQLIQESFLGKILPQTDKPTKNTHYDQWKHQMTNEESI